MPDLGAIRTDRSNDGQGIAWFVVAFLEELLDKAWRAPLVSTGDIRLSPIRACLGTSIPRRLTSAVHPARTSVILPWPRRNLRKHI